MAKSGSTVGILTLSSVIDLRQAARAARQLPKKKIIERAAVESIELCCRCGPTREAFYVLPFEFKAFRPFSAKLESYSVRQQ
jgi:hypothetical protein